MLLTIFTLSLVAQAAPAESAAIPKTRLAVLALKNAGTPESFVEGVTETFATSAGNTGVFEVISPRQVAAVLAYEKRKELVGTCAEEDCYLQIARLVRAKHIVGGSIAQVGKKVVLNMVLIDAARGRALGRINREAQSAAALMAAVRPAAIILLQPLLVERQGYLKVALNTDGADLVVDDRQRAEGAGQVMALAAGPHILRVDKDGFYSTTADVFVRPGRVTVEEINLIPAKATVEAYERRATWMRAGAWTTGALAVGAAIGAGVFYSQATDNKDFTDRYASALAVERADLGGYDRYLDERNSFDTNQGLYLGLLAGAIVSGAVSAYLFIAGDPPGRYDEYEAIAE